MEVITDVGQVPKASGIVGHKETAIANEWRTALEPLLNEVKHLQSLGWLENSRYARLCELVRMIGKARKSRIHKDRMKMLRCLTESKSVA